ncbi:MAG: hypothetical protein ACRYG6_17555, partial [Janthinobacterium lividum]
MSLRRTAVHAFCLAALLCLGGGASAEEDSAPIPWKGGASFSRTSVDDDLRNVLRAVLAASDLSVIFRPGVDGKVSFAFRDMSPQAAFDQLVAENGLHAGFN